MAKYIAHASIDENGKAKGGAAGDQTGKEVCIRTWYSKPWNQFFHIDNAKVRKQFGNNMIDIAKNNNVGYDQNQRNTLLTQAKKVKFDFTKITTKCETDCSAAITTALLGAIYTILGEKAYEEAYDVMVVSGNCATTSTLKARLTKLTVIKVTCYTSSAYVASTSKAVFGDIYNKSGSHVVCYIDNGNKASVTTTTSTAKTYSGTFPALPTRGYYKLGDGYKTLTKYTTQIKRLQKFLNWCMSSGLTVDGQYGEKTVAAVKAFQKKYSLTVDGQFGAKSLTKAKTIKK